MRLQSIAAVVALGLLAGCGDDKPPPKVTPTVIDPATCGGITGLVRFEGTPKAPRTLSMSDSICVREAENVLKGVPVDPSFRVTALPDGSGYAVKDAFVWISKGLEGKAFAWPETPAILDQKGCVFEPHVLGVMAWQEVMLRNSDPVAHNVSCLRTTVNKRFNVTLASAGATEKRRFQNPEAGVEVRCDVHPWMNAILHVVDNPYFAVTGADGTFSIGSTGAGFNLPAGNYVVSVWTQTMGKVDIPVTVVAGKSVAVPVPSFRRSDG